MPIANLFAVCPKSNEIQTKDLFSLLDNNIGTTTSKTCRANLGDDDCRVDLSSYTFPQLVTAIVDRRIFSIDGTAPNQYFDRGRLQFTSGANLGLHFDISYYQNNQIILAQPVPFDLTVGDSLTAIAGCAKTKLACIRFGNFANFVGEPDVPTTDLAINTPSR